MINHPKSDYPMEIPMKIIGKQAELDASRIADLISEHLGARALASPNPTVRINGPWVSLTFQVILPDEHAEKPLREAIHKLSGVVMQL